MRRILLAGATLLAFTAAQPTLAADLRTKGPLLAPAPVSSWSGFYVGLNGGWASSSVRWTNEDALENISNVALGTTFSTSPSGGLIGGQFGWQRQWENNWVFGLELSYSAADLRSSQFVSLAGQFDDTFTTKISGLLLATARIGYAWDRTLLFFKAGLAGATVAGSVVDTITNGGQVGTAPNTWQASRWHTGWTVGLGAGFKLRPNLSVGVEYNYVRLQSLSHSAVVLNSVGGPVSGAVATSGAAYSIRPEIHAVMFSLNLHL